MHDAEMTMSEVLRDPMIRLMLRAIECRFASLRSSWKTPPAQETPATPPQAKPAAYIPLH